MVDEQPQAFGPCLLACEDLDVRLGRREALFDVCLEALNLHVLTKKVDLAAHLQAPPARAAYD